MSAPTVSLHGASLRPEGGGEVPLRSGAMHYWRLSRDSWREGLRQLKAMGLPMVETYAPWQVHEPEPGQWDFGQTDPRKDLGAFLDMAAEEGLQAFVRPGPHINSEMTYFGLPAHIVHDPAMQARSPSGRPVILYFPPRMFPVPSHASEAYLSAVGRWFEKVAEVLRPRLHPEGNVVLLQVDNEVGYYFRNGPFCQDYHEDALVQWIAHLEDAHGSLDRAAEAHGTPYATWADALPPKRFGEGVHGEEPEPGELTLQLDWATFQERLLTGAIERMADQMREVGLGTVPLIHNVSLGEQGLQANVPALGEAVDLVGLDYYHPAREHRTIKRRTLYLDGTTGRAYAPELGVGAPPWFTPLGHDDSLYTALCALAYGLRGFNLYMAVDRDRWYGAAIDSRGRPRPEAADWMRLNEALEDLAFHGLERKADVALMIPREYARYARQTHLLGPISPSTLEAVGGTPIDGCRGDALGFDRPIQLCWWQDLARLARGLTAAGVPYRYVDSDAPMDRWKAHRLVIAPSYAFADPERWARLADLAEAGVTVVTGPSAPTKDTTFRDAPFSPVGERLELDDDLQVQAAIHAWVDRFSLRRPYPTKPPLETSLHEDERGDRVLFVLNPSHESHRAQVLLPRPTTATDRLSGELFEGDEKLSVPMRPQHARLLSLEAKR